MSEMNRPPLRRIGRLSTNRFLRTDSGLQRFLQAGRGKYDPNSQTETLYQENLSHLKQINPSLKISSLMLEVDKKLGNFSTEARKMGRSFSLLVATQNLRKELAGVEYASQKNLPGRFSRQDAAQNHSSPNLILSHMCTFASVLEEFHECIQDFREYDDGSINMKGTLRALCSDIKYWSLCLRDYEGLFSSQLVKDYANQLIGELKNRIAEMASNLDLFMGIGIPAIRHEQKRKADVLLMLSTGATFFSAVTATMLQVSYTIPLHPTLVIVNTLWFCSLVLSIGAALNSVLAMVWKQTIHGSRGNKLPPWVTLWINASPAGFLFISIVCFSAGLVLFVFSSDQNPFTSWFTLATTIITSVGLSASTLWMVHEQITALGPPKSPSSLDTSGVTPNWYHGDSYSQQQNGNSNSSLTSASSQSHWYDVERQGWGKPAPGLGGLSTMMSMLLSPIIPNQRGLTTTGTNQHPHEPKTIELRPIDVNLKDETDPLPGSPSEAPKMEVIMHLKGGKTQLTTQAPFRHINLEKFGVLQNFKFSPDGKYLATTSWKELEDSTESTVIIFRDLDQDNFDKRYVYQPNLLESRSGPRQLTWSYDSAYLLIRYERAIDVWTLGSRTIRHIIRHDSIQAIRWYNEEKAFLCIENHLACKLNLDGTEEWRRRFTEIQLYDASVTLKHRLVLLGHLVSIGDAKPSHPSVAEKRIIVYDGINDKETKSKFKEIHCVPLLDNVNHITAVSNEEKFLISYRSKKPPQIWSLSDSESVQSPDLILECSYQATFEDEFEGVSYTSNSSNSGLVLSTGRDGDIHFWDLKDGKSAHHFRVGGGSFLSAFFPEVEGAPDTIKFATGNASGISFWRYSKMIEKSVI